MRTFLKYTAAVTLAGALAVASVVPSQARWNGHHHWRNGGAIGAGIAAAAVLGAVAANGYYGPGYGYGPTYGYGPGYAYGSGYGADYAYEPAPVYGAPRHYYGNWNAQDCTQSPASPNFRPCNN